MVFSSVFLKWGPLPWRIFRESKEVPLDVLEDWNASLIMRLMNPSTIKDIPKEEPDKREINPAIIKRIEKIVPQGEGIQRISIIIPFKAYS